MLKRWLKDHRSLAATVTSCGVIAALVATVAVVSGGYEAQKVNLNDASVWVANGERHVIGRANTQVLEFNSIVEADGAELEVVQHGADVLMLDRGNARIDIIDPATSTVIDGVPTPTVTPRVFLAGENAVLTDGDGRVWMMPVADLATFDLESEPTLNLGGGAVYSVDAQGQLAAYSQAAAQFYLVDAAGSMSTVQTMPQPFDEDNAQLSVARIGGSWLLFDAISRQLVIDGRELDLSDAFTAADRPRLQSSTESGSEALIAFSGGLLSVPLASAEPRTLVDGRGGFAAAPVEVDGCTYAAWSDGGAWRKCGDGAGELLTLDAMPAGAAQLTFNVNDARVVLNDPASGATWAVQRSGELIDNWDQLINVAQDDNEIVVDDPDAETEFEKVQQPPVAVPDEFGARPGRSSVLPVLLNDYDPNGDVLVISLVTPLDEAIGRLDLINNRQQLQLSLTPAASGVLTFDYTISDGRGGEATARVTVTVRSAGENSPPQQVRNSSTLVAERGRVSTPVLGDWVDPDGDSIYLSSAAVAGPDQVSYKPEGVVVFTEGGGSGPSRTVTLGVTDGSAEGFGTLTVEVSPAGEVPIIAEPFVVLAYAGQEIRVSPLEHVRGGTGEVRLGSVPSVAGATITTNLERGTFRFLSEQPRTFNLEYVVNDGTQSATGIVRIDVAAPPDAGTKPITVPKTVFVQTLGTETVDIAGTDIDPAGGVLLLTGVYNIPSGSGIQAEILEQRAVRVTLTAPFDSGPVTFNYRVSNGLAEAEGVVTVVEIPRPTLLQPPVAVSDATSVRVGAAIDIPVLANDSHPDGEELTLSPKLATTLGDGAGLLFAAGNILRYLAPQEPGNFTATYEVTGPDGQAAQAQVQIAVREAVPETNQPPAPQPVIARVLAGESVTISIPLSGIDPDGDTVQLLGQATNPQKGAVVGVTADTLTYEAGTYSAGTDTFTYTVVDALGARATGTVRVGITARLDGPRNPVATADEVLTRPGSTVTVQVLGNDSDPDGSPLTVVGVEPNTPDIVAETNGEVVTVIAPAAPGSYGIIYRIQNELGGTSSAFLTVTVDPEAPLSYPVATDTVLTLTDVLDRDEVDVNVLAGVFFADGPVSSLRVSLLPGFDSAAQLTDGQRIRVRVQDKSQIIPFGVAHPADSTIVSYAFIWVPGYDDALPQVNRRARPLTIPSESTLRIPLAEYVVAIGGGTVRLADRTTVQATHANGDSLVIDDHTLVFTSADKYFGPASISFEVTDGASANDPNGRRATLVLPIDVTPRENQPPVFNGGVIEFEPAEEKVLDLLQLTTYPYPDDLDELTYTALAPLPVGFSYSLTGQELVIRAAENAVKGSTTALVLGVRDDLAVGKAGSIQLSVVASSRPLARPADDIAIAARGQTTVVDVLANDEPGNPFPGSPMSVIDVRGIDGSALPAGVQIVPSTDNRRLSVTVAEDAAPHDINIQYRVLDATRDMDRAVWGSVRVQIQDVPDPVTGVTVTSFGDRRLTVAWTPGAANNSPITGYEVIASRAGGVVSTTTCAITSGCDIPTPGNGPEHSLTVAVVAINSIGRGAPATAPSSAWSDVLPAAPSGISAVPTNTAPAGGSISVSWSPVPDPSPGSALVGYTIRIVGPGVDLSPTVGPGTTTFAFSNGGGELAPATQYSVSVYARNSAQVLSSAAWQRNAPVAVTTVGPPSQTAGGVAAAVVNAQGHIRVTWGASAANGAPSVNYSVGRFNASDAMPTVCRAPSPGSGGPVASGWVDTSTDDGGTYRYVVFADNGYYCTPTASGSVLSLRPPGQASGSVVLEAHGGQYDARAGTDLAVASLSAEKFQYQVNGGAWRDVPADRWLTSIADSSVYGHPLTISFRGCRDLSDGFCGPASAPQTITPVNARASVLSCVIGEDALANPPINAGSPTVSYLWSFNDGAVLGSWTTFDPNPKVPPPGLLGSQVSVRVKAVVDFGTGTQYPDPGYAEAVCSP